MARESARALLPVLETKQDGFDRGHRPRETHCCFVRQPDPDGDVERHEHEQRCSRRPAESGHHPRRRWRPTP